MRPRKRAGPCSGLVWGQRQCKGPGLVLSGLGTIPHTQKDPLSQSLLSLLRRACFPDLQHGYLVAWLVLDYTSDLFYLLDIVVRFHTGQ